MNELLARELDQALDPRRPLKHVLVASDLSAGANLALARALRLPFAHDAMLTVLHVCQTSDTRAILSLQRELRAVTAETVARGSPGEREGAPRIATLTASDGTPDDEIVSHAVELGADLIVVGRHGGRTVRGLLVGSTLGRLLPRASVPVLVVSAPADGPYRRPLAALDSDASGHSMLEGLLRLCAPDIDRADVLHVARSAAASLDQARSAVEKANHSCLEEWRTCGVSPCWRVTGGAAAPVILATARELGSDVVGAGTHGRENAACWILGSTAEKLLSEARCDVLVARARP